MHLSLWHIYLLSFLVGIAAGYFIKHRWISYPLGCLGGWLLIVSPGLLATLSANTADAAGAAEWVFWLVPALPIAACWGIGGIFIGRVVKNGRINQP